MSDPWEDEWAAMTYTERLNWWWAARRAYQNQDDFAAGLPAAEGVSCKYGIPGFLPGTRTPYRKPAQEEAKPVTDEVKPAQEEAKVEQKEEEVAPKQEQSHPETEMETETDKSGTVNLIIPPGSSTLNVNNSNKKKKNKNNKHTNNKH